MEKSRIGQGVILGLLEVPAWRRVLRAYTQKDTAKQKSDMQVEVRQDSLSSHTLWQRGLSACLGVVALVFLIVGIFLVSSLLQPLTYRGYFLPYVYTFGHTIDLNMTYILILVELASLLIATIGVPLFILLSSFAALKSPVRLQPES